MMNLFDKFMHILDSSMKEPSLYGWYHLFWIAFMIGSCLLIYRYRKHFNKNKINLILLVIGIFLIVGETYKQLIHSFNYNDGSPYYEYNWRVFPFQFCSTPIYLIPIAALLKKGKFYDFIISFLATYALFAGLAVMIYPGDVFGSTIGLNIYTMFLHASMVAIGFMLLVSQVELDFKTVWKGSIIFIFVTLIALLLNIIFYLFGNPTSNFNMFYISPFERSTFPILGWMHHKLPYIFILLTYCGVFTLAAITIMFLSRKLFKEKIS